MPVVKHAGADAGEVSCTALVHTSRALAPCCRWLPADMPRTAPMQVAGYKVEYEGLTYLTIKGAGHMVGGGVCACLPHSALLRACLTLFHVASEHTLLPSAPLFLCCVCNAGADEQARPGFGDV